MDPFVNDLSSLENDLLELLNTAPPNQTIDHIFEMSNQEIQTPLNPNDHVTINPQGEKKYGGGEYVYDPSSEIFEDIVLPSDEEMKELMLLLEDEVFDAVVSPLMSSEGENELPFHDLGDVTRAKVEVLEEKSASGKQTRTSWTTEEHRMFLLGMKVHGRGKWRIISKDFIPTKTAIQIASHAQKYFNHQRPRPKGKRRSRPSIHDIRNINPLMPSVSFNNINIPSNLCYRSNNGVLGRYASESNISINNGDIAPTAASYNFQAAPGDVGENVASISTSEVSPYSFGPFGF